MLDQQTPKTIADDYSPARAAAPPRTPEPSAPPTPRRATRRTFRRRSRVRIVGVLVALGLVLVANLAVQVNRRYWDVQSDGYLGLRRLQQCEALGHALDVLYLGSSHTMYGIDAQRIDNQLQTQTGARTLGCNVGMLGSTFEQDYYMLKRYLEDGNTPKVVVETLWEWNLNVNAQPRADTSGEHVMQDFTLANLGDLSTLRSHFTGQDGSHNLGTFVASKTIPLYGDRAGLLHALCGKNTVGPCGKNIDPLAPGTQSIYSGSDSRGWVAIRTAGLSQMSASELKAAATGRWGYFGQQLNNFTIGGQQPGYLARLVSLAQAHGVKLEFVLTPLHPSYYQFFSGPNAWPQVVAYWRQFAAAHDVPLYDDSHASGYTAADFADPQHLTASGAAKFSGLLAAQVVGPALAASPARTGP